MDPARSSPTMVPYPAASRNRHRRRHLRQFLGRRSHAYPHHIRLRHPRALLCVAASGGRHRTADALHGERRLRYDASSDSEEQLTSRLDGILSSIEPGDILIFQHPSWNLLSFDRKLLEQARNFSGVKIAIFVHDIVNLMFEGEEKLFGEAIDLFNMADQPILPSRQMEARFRAQGLSVPSVLIQECWNRPLSFELPEPAFSRDIRFSGSPSRFPFVHDWTGRSMLHIYADERPEDAGPTVAFEGLKKPQQLLSCLAEGGSGLSGREAAKATTA